MNKLTEEQIAIVNATESKVLVEASAASGKTHTLIARLQHLIDTGANQRNIVAITFTNNAAAEMRSRLNGVTDMFIGTVHSYCNFLLAVGGVNTNDLISKENFDELFNRIKLHPECVSEVDYLLVDEAQDSTAPQFEFFLKTLKPKNYMLFFDLRQSIYGFANADPDFLIELRHQPDVTRYPLTLNYRNGEDILEYAKDLIASLGSEYYDRSMSMTNSFGEVHHCTLTMSQVIDNIIRESDDPYGDWFILCRANKDVDTFVSLLNKRKIPCTTFKQGDLNNKEIHDRMKSNCVKVLTMHSSKGLESKNVIVWNPLPWLNPEERRLCYVCATRAKENLWWVRSGKSKKTRIRNWE